MLSWRKWIKPLAFGLYVTLVCIALPFCILELNKKNAPSNVQAWFIGGIFVMAALPVSLFSILEHLIHYTKPYLQRYIIRILWMVPIYALNAWFALRYPHAAIYLDTMRECYEAYVIYNFMAYLLSYLRHEYPDLEFMIEQKTQVKHMVPLCCCPPWPMGRSFIDRCRHGALQYTVVRPIMTCVALILELCGVYGEGEYDFKKGFVYILFINNASQVWAMYCLILFYRCAKEELAPMHPVAKFLIVKAVVFMSFWQAILISILAASGVIQQVEAWKLYDVKSISVGLQDFAICIEMFLAAIAHHFAFPVRPFVDPEAPYHDCCRSCLSMWDVSDVRHDVVEHVRHVAFDNFFISSYGDLPSEEEMDFEMKEISHTVRQKLPRPPGFGRRTRLLSNEATPLLDPASAGMNSGAETETPVLSCTEEDDFVGGSYTGVVDGGGGSDLMPGPAASNDTGLDAELGTALTQSMTNLLLASQTSSVQAGQDSEPARLSPRLV